MLTYSPAVGEMSSASGGGGGAVTRLWRCTGERCNHSGPTVPKFCPECGTPQRGVVPRKLCECGLELPEEAKNCPKCNPQASVSYPIQETNGEGNENKDMTRNPLPPNIPLAERVATPVDKSLENSGDDGPREDETIKTEGTTKQPSASTSKTEVEIKPHLVSHKRTISETFQTPPSSPTSLKRTQSFVFGPQDKWKQGEASGSLGSQTPAVTNPGSNMPAVKPSTQVVSTQVASTQVTSTQVASTQVTSTQVASTQVVSTQVASTQVASTQVASTQVASTQVASTQVVSTEKKSASGAVNPIPLPDNANLDAYRADHTRTHNDTPGAYDGREDTRFGVGVTF